MTNQTVHKILFSIVIYCVLGSVSSVQPPRRSVKVTPYEYARICVHMYEGDSHSDSRLDSPPDWVIFDSWENYMGKFIIVAIFGNVYNGVVYGNHKKKQIVFAHQYSQSTTTLESRSDQGYVMCHSPPDVLDIALEFMRNVTIRLSEKFHDYEFSCTGYGIGAAIAELSAAKMRIPSVTFESPGIANVITNADKSFSDEDLQYIDDIAVSYLTAPNAWNTIGEHVGTIFRLFIEGSYYLYADDSYGGQPNALFYTFMYSTFYMDSMLLILDCFNPLSGYPKVLGSASSWPRLFIKSCSASTVQQPDYVTDGGSTGHMLRTLLDCNGTQCGGYSHYLSYDWNTYYWNQIQPLIYGYSVGFRRMHETDFIADLGLSLYRDAFVEDTLGVTISGDDSGNLITGASNFDDYISAGIGDDVIYLFGGVDVCVDRGGYDLYYLPPRNVSYGRVGSMGRKLIDDWDGLGSVYVGSQYVGGRAYAITSSSCSQVTSSDYLLPLSNQAFIARHNGSDLFLFAECEAIDEADNLIQIKDFSSGHLGIILVPASTDRTVVVAGDGSRPAECMHDRHTCFVYSPSGGAQIAVLGNHTARIYGNYFSTTGNRIVVTMTTANESNNDGNIQIMSVKGGDAVEVRSELTSPALNIPLTVTSDGFVGNRKGLSLKLSAHPDYLPASFSVVGDVVAVGRSQRPFYTRRPTVHYSIGDIGALVRSQHAPTQSPVRPRPTSTPTVVPVALIMNKYSDVRPFSTTAQIGIAVGGVVLIVLALLLVYFLYVKKRRHESQVELRRGSMKIVAFGGASQPAAASAPQIDDGLENGAGDDLVDIFLNTNNSHSL